MFVSFSANGAELLYRQGFEEPVSSQPEIQWETHGYEVTQAIVELEGERNGSAISGNVIDSEFLAKEGKRSVRGNFNPNVVDPITKLTGSPFVQLKLNFKDIPSLRDWYPKTESIYVSWWFKLDKCFWQGPNFENDDPLRTAGKFAFLRMNEDPATSYYFTMNGGVNGAGALSANSWNNLWEEWYGRPSLWLSNGKGWGSDGKWHKLSFFIGRKDNGNKYLMWWIDDELMKSDRFDAEGKHRVYDEFVLDSIQFWHSSSRDTSDSKEMDGPGICNGWQIDDVQVWDGIPPRPLPPRSM